MTYDAVVVGLGVMGSAAAWRLAARGRSVLGIDARRPPHALGSSHGGSRIIRETSFEHPRYTPLARRAWALWDELAAATGQHDLLVPTGALYIGPPGAAVVEASRASAREHGVETEDVTAAEIAGRWPAIQVPHGAVGLHERRAGVLRPEACVGALHWAARGRGAELALDEAVTDWQVSDGRVSVRTAARTITASRLVLATGPWMQAELAALGVAVWIERVVQHWFAPAGDAARLAPARCPVYLWEDGDGVVFYGFPLLDGEVKCAIHHRGEATSADAVRRTVLPDEVARTRERLARLLPDAAGRHTRSAVCVYTNTADGDFIVARHPRHPEVVLLSPCSGIGFKFAPAIGELAADLADGHEPAAAAAFGLDRLRS